MSETDKGWHGSLCNSTLLALQKINEDQSKYDPVGRERLKSVEDVIKTRKKMEGGTATTTAPA